MKLPPGATGFDATPGAGLDRSAFAALCHHAARAVGGTVGPVTPAGATPNFHSAEITAQGQSTTVLGHSTVPFVAFAESGDPITFVDRPDLAAAIQAVSDVAVLAAQQLDAALATADLSALSAGERKQIAYWQPATVGELLFNVWD